MAGRRTVVCNLDLVSLFLKCNEVPYTTNLPLDAKIVQVGIDGDRGVLHLVFESDEWTDSLIITGRPTGEKIFTLAFTKSTDDAPASASVSDAPGVH